LLAVALPVPFAFIAINMGILFGALNGVIVWAWAKGLRQLRWTRQQRDRIMPYANLSLMAIIFIINWMIGQIPVILVDATFDFGDAEVWGTMSSKRSPYSLP
jgi:hypothetical protein